MTSKNERGLVLVIVLGLVLLFVLSFAYFMLMSTREITALKSQDEFIRAFYLAEAGLERARYDLTQDNNWADGVINSIDCGDSAPGATSFYSLPYTSTSLGGGSYSINLKNIVSGTDPYGGVVYEDGEIWARSRGTYHGKSRAIQAKLISAREYQDLANNVTMAIEAEGGITLQGSAEIIGSYNEHADVSFDDVFGMTKEEMKEIAQEHFPSTYYNVTSSQTAFKDDTATQLTWIQSPDYLSQVTSANWTGNGILIVEGNLKLTGGTFGGVVWVSGELSVGAGGTTINGGVFVESGVTVDTTISGNATIDYEADDISAAFSVLSNTLSAAAEEWEEVAP